MSITIDTTRLSRPQESSTYLAIRSTQGGRTVFTFRAPLFDLSTILIVPTPDQPDKDNRKVTPLHAKQFGQYLHNSPEWVAPSLLVRDGGGCTFEPITPDGSVGYLTVPWAVGGISPLRTIDGQHRILGVYFEKKRITDAIADIDRQLSRKVSAEKSAKLTTERADLVARMERLKAEYVGIDVYVEPDPVKAQQMFVDVADNAKGISKAVLARFDTTRVANRVMSDVAEHPLLKGRVDIESDRITNANRNFIGAKHVADLTRAVIAGVGGRMSAAAEKAASDGAVIERVHSFLDVLSSMDTFEPMVEENIEDVPDGVATASQTVRGDSLVGSVGMLRMLAAVYGNLTSGDKPADPDEITAFFQRLDKHLESPVTEDSIWRTSATGVDFEPNAYAPIMRQQNLVHAVQIITSWFKKAPAGF
ncbi:DNA sulfur modification protein DndB [Streptomyces clavifer]|uniref:DNA sulfur modification protein DndB n=1 Tax=Streptomyces clavifer TaxID=68188 RepID=UPI0037A547F8